MHRRVYALDITDFRPMNSAKPKQFLDWITRSFRTEDPDEAETASEAIQSARGTGSGIEMIGAWYAVGVTGHDQFRAFSMYECHGGWNGGWRDMMALYRGVPDSMFLSSIDDVRFGATTLPLVAVPGCPDTGAGPAGAFAMIEIAGVRPGQALDYLEAVREIRSPALEDHGYTLAGLYEVAFSRTEAVSLWTTDIDAQVAVQRARDSALGWDDEVAPDRRLLEWDDIAARFHTGRVRDLYLAAYPGPVLSPGRIFITG